MGSRGGRGRCWAALPQSPIYTCTAHTAWHRKPPIGTATTHPLIPTWLDNRPILSQILFRKGQIFEVDLRLASGPGLPPQAGHHWERISPAAAAWVSSQRPRRLILSFDVRSPPLLATLLHSCCQSKHTVRANITQCRTSRNADLPQVSVARGQAARKWRKCWVKPNAFGKCGPKMCCSRFETLVMSCSGKSFLVLVPAVKRISFMRPFLWRPQYFAI